MNNNAATRSIIPGLSGLLNRTCFSLGVMEGNVMEKVVWKNNPALFCDTLFIHFRAFTMYYLYIKSFKQNKIQ